MFTAIGIVFGFIAGAVFAAWRLKGESSLKDALVKLSGGPGPRDR